MANEALPPTIAITNGIVYCLPISMQKGGVCDNSDISRIPAPTEKDYGRLEKYRRAMATLS